MTRHLTDATRIGLALPPRLWGHLAGIIRRDPETTPEGREILASAVRAFDMAVNDALSGTTDTERRKLARRLDRAANLALSEVQCGRSIAAVLLLVNGLTQALIEGGHFEVSELFAAAHTAVAELVYATAGNDEILDAAARSGARLAQRALKRLREAGYCRDMAEAATA